MFRPVRPGQLLHFTPGRLAKVTDARPKAQGQVSRAELDSNPRVGPQRGRNMRHHLPTGSKAHSGWAGPLRRSDPHVVLRKYLLKSRVNAQKHR